MNKKRLLLLSTTFLLTGCFFKPVRPTSSNNVSTTSETTSQGGISTTTTSTQTTSIDPSLTGTREFDFTNTSITTGSDIANKGPNEKLTSFMNADGEILSSISSSHCTFQNVPDSDKTVMTVGTGSYGGSITFSFLYKITQISVVLQGYCKHIQYTGVDAWSMDANSKIDINGHTFNLGSTDENQPPKVEKTFSLDTATNTITMSNDEGVERAFVYKLTVTYLVE